MSDRDPLEQLARFGTGGPVSPLPPAEVRRLGDRRRVRRTAVSAVAGAVAVLAVAIPLGLHAGGGSGHPVPPTTSSTGPTSLRTTIPSGFPILTGLDRALQQAPVEQGPGDLMSLPFCGTAVWPVPATDRLSATVPGIESGPSWSRDLLLLRSPDAATKALSRISAVLEQCGREKVGDPAMPDHEVDFLHTVLDVDVVGADQAVTWTDNYADGGHSGSITQVVRVGNALAATKVAGTGTGYPPEELPTNGPSAALVTAMQVFAAPRLPGAIPSDFPLDHGLVPASPADHRLGDLNGPTHTDLGVLPVDVCGPVAWSPTPSDHLDLTFRSASIEESRAVALYADSATAARQVARFRDAVTRCEQRTYVTVVPRTTVVAADDVVAWTRADDGGRYDSFIVLAVGPAVLLVSSGGPAEGARITADVGYRQQAGRIVDEAAAWLAPRLCGLTDSGCSVPATTETPAAPADCTASDLHGMEMPLVGAALGTTYADLRFTNTSDSPCTIHGASSLKAVTADRQQLAGGDSISDEFALAPGQYASVRVRESNPANYPDGDCGPRTVTVWRITVPGSREALDVAATPGTRTCTQVTTVSMLPWKPEPTGR